MTRLANKVALVTGGAQGVGRAVVQRFAAEGARVVAADLDETLMVRTAKELSSHESPVEAVGGDISRRTDVHLMVQRCLDRFGRLDILVANAGTSDVQPFLEIDDPRWRHILDVNLNGTFYCIQEAARAMVRGGGGGAIVVTASTNAFWMESGLAAYNTSKGGVIGLVRSAAIELAPLGIRVNAVEPSVVRTRLSKVITDDPTEAAKYLERIPLNRFAEPTEVADSILFLASDEASYISGHALILDGGLTLGLKLDLPPGPVTGPVGQ